VCRASEILQSVELVDLFVGYKGIVHRWVKKECHPNHGYNFVNSCKIRFKWDFFIIYPTKKLPNVVKISAKINTMQNIKILLFVCSLSFNKVKALQLSMVGLSTIKHQHSKKLTRWIERTWTKNTWKMLIVCKSLFTNGVQNVLHLHRHMSGDAFFSGQLQSQ